MANKVQGSRPLFGQGGSTCLSSNDVVMGIDFFAQNAQLLLAWGSRRRRRTGQVQGKARGLLYLLQLDAWVKAQNVHPLAAGVVSHDGEIGDHAIRAGARGQTSGLASAGTSEIAWGGQDVELVHEAAAVVIGHHQDVPAQRSTIIGAAAACKAYAWPDIVAADHRRVEIAVGIDLGAAQKTILNQAA